MVFLVVSEIFRITSSPTVYLSDIIKGPCIDKHLRELVKCAYSNKKTSYIDDFVVYHDYTCITADKLKVLNLLIQQFLTYAATRDTLEDNYDKLRQLKYDLRHLQWAEQRREKEELAMR